MVRTHSTSRSRSHSSSVKSVKTVMMAGNRMRILTLKALEDNYMYLLMDSISKEAAAVDPVNASAMASAVHDEGANLKAILTTHHHYDHAHGNAELLSMFPHITVLGGDSRVQALTKSVSHGEQIKLGSLNIECLSTPCHTKGHICYHVTADQDPEGERVVFTGDTLFVAGCGRFFEGTAQEMDRNLNEVLGKLPGETRVFPGHEYTVTNLKFALSIEPQNMDIKSKLNWAKGKAAKSEPTVPSTIADEKKTNPFMRLSNPQVRKCLLDEEGEHERESIDDSEVMGALRRLKNKFTG